MHFSREREFLYIERIHLIIGGMKDNSLFKHFAHSAVEWKGALTMTE